MYTPKSLIRFLVTFASPLVPRTRTLPHVKSNLLPVTLSVFTIIFLIVLCGDARGNFTNGSFTGPTSTWSLTPPGWTPTETPDTVSTAGHPFGGSFYGIAFQPYGASRNGGTFAWAIAHEEPREAVSQALTGLSVGTPIEISFEYTNLALYDSAGRVARDAFRFQNYENSGIWQVQVDGATIATTPTMPPFSTPGTHTWSTFSTTFIPTHSTHTITFAALSTTSNGSGHVGMGIDGASAVPIPEPATLTLLALGGLALVRRRKRWMCK
jgi:hypothetical protein